MSNQLDVLRSMSVVVADTGDIALIRRFRPQDATTNPSLLLKAIQMPEYAHLVKEALREAAELGMKGEPTCPQGHVVDLLTVKLAGEILGIIPGRVSIEIDARLSYDTDATVARVQGILALLERRGIDKGRVYIKIAATWEGIRACEVLQKEGVDCNMTLIFSFAQAVACAQAGAALVSPFVGRILDWYKKRDGDVFTPADDPGVLAVRRVYEYFKAKGHGTSIMAASFRNTGEILQLAGIDKITISPALLAELEGNTEVEGMERMLVAEKAESVDEVGTLDKEGFEAMHQGDPMAAELLPAGIDAFVRDTVELERIIEAALKA